MKQARLSKVNLPSSVSRRRRSRSIRCISTEMRPACSLSRMAQTRKKRRRKHRGTQAGTIDRAGRTGRPRTKEEAKAITRQRRQQRLYKPPSLKVAVQRAGIAAAVFGVLVVLLFGRDPAQGAI